MSHKAGFSGPVEATIYEVTNMTEKTVRPSLARRLAAAAVMTTTLLQPMGELLAAVSPHVDIMEIACAQESTLTTVFEEQGFNGKRINYLSGYDLDSRIGASKLAVDIKETVPRLAWVSMACTRLSALQNLTPRTPEQMDRFFKRRGRDLKRCDEIAESLEPVLAAGNDFAWEWPTTAVTGWKSKAIKRLLFLLKRYGRTAYWIRVDGCAYGLEWRGVPLRKAWTILTSSREMWLAVNKRCDRSHEHAVCRGEVAQASAYYPRRLCQEVCKAMAHHWRHQSRSVERDVENYLLSAEEPTDIYDVTSTSDY